MKTMAGSMSRWSSSSTISVRGAARNGQARPPAPATASGPSRPCRARRTAWSMRRPSPPGSPVRRAAGAAAASPRPRAGARRSGGAGRWAAARSTITAVSPAHRAQPAPELVGVVHGGRQADEADLGRGQDEDLLPHAAAVRVLDEVDLVEDDGVQALEQVGAGQEHVAQDLGRHDDDRRPRAHGRVAGQQPDVVLAVGGDQLAVLLVGERLERRRVEGLAPCAPGPGGRRRPPPASCPIRSAPRRGPSGRRRGQRSASCWKSSRANGQVGLELRRPGRLLDGPREGGQRPSSFPMPMEMK